MTVNIIKKECPQCKHPDSDIQGSAITSEEIKGKVVKKSYNHYKCIKCKRPFLVERTGNLKEQELTEKYIKSSKIILN